MRSITFSDQTMLTAAAKAAGFRQKLEAARKLDHLGLSAVEMPKVCDPYSSRAAHAALKEGKIVIFAGGSGCPFFSTDTTASLRAAEVEAEVILMAKNIDAVYSDDPNKNPDAVRFTHLTHAEVLEKDLKVMDATAAAMCRDNNIAIHVFGLAEENGIMRAICGEEIGTIVE